jgi:hypothetical protein
MRENQPILKTKVITYPYIYTIHSKEKFLLHNSYFFNIRNFIKLNFLKTPLLSSLIVHFLFHQQDIFNFMSFTVEYLIFFSLVYIRMKNKTEATYIGAFKN